MKGENVEILGSYVLVMKYFTVHHRLGVGNQSVHRFGAGDQLASQPACWQKSSRVLEASNALS